MKVYISALAEQITEDIVTLRKLMKLVHSEGHTLADDWIEPAYTRESKGVSLTPEEWQKIYVDSRDAIAKSDVIIAEVSKRSFGVGYQVATAVQLKKPILLLRRHNATESAMAMGIAEQNVDFQRYTEANVERIVQSFLRQNDIPLKDMRFNFFINRQIYNYLRAASAKTGKTKAEIIRELVKREIDKDK